ncbi:HNH endonuclease [Stomatohabitans albus]|uniref:HNH endonuclease n=1 Tax=Stomatohabitans albus TaxID=3110766 RepID=UPI00300C4F6A
MAGDPRTSGVARRAYRARAKAIWETNGGICEICREPLDMKVPWPDPDSFVADHVTPITGGGRVDGAVRPAHNRCNIKRGANAHDTLGPTSRPWRKAVC